MYRKLPSAEKNKELGIPSWVIHRSFHVNFVRHYQTKNLKRFDGAIFVKISQN